MRNDRYPHDYSILEAQARKAQEKHDDSNVVSDLRVERLQRIIEGNHKAWLWSVPLSFFGGGMVGYFIGVLVR